MGDRQKVAGGRGEADCLPFAVRYLLATEGQGPADDGQQRLQRLALRRRVAGRVTEMKRNLGSLAIAGPLIMVLFCADPALAQRAGGILRMFSPDSPASMSILEESTVFAEGPMMGVFNNLVMVDQHVKQTSLDSIVP